MPRRNASRRPLAPSHLRTEISAGGVVYRERDAGGSDVVLVRTQEGRWQLPKGWVEDGEERHAAAVRECREEAGVVAEVVGPIDTIEYWFRATYEQPVVRVHKYVYFFLLRYISGTPDDHDDEVEEARWVEIGEAQRMLAFKDERRMVATAEAALSGAADDPGIR